MLPFYCGTVLIWLWVLIRPCMPGCICQLRLFYCSHLMLSTGHFLELGTKQQNNRVFLEWRCTFSPITDITLDSANSMNMSLKSWKFDFHSTKVSCLIKTPILHFFADIMQCEVSVLVRVKLESSVCDWSWTNKHWGTNCCGTCRNHLTQHWDWRQVWERRWWLWLSSG